MDYETRTQFGLEPCCLGRHDVACVGNLHQLVHGDGIEGESHLHLTAVDTAFQLAQAADTADEVDTFVGTQVGDAQDVAQDEVGAYGNVKDTDGVLVIVSAGFGCE